MRGETDLRLYHGLFHRHPRDIGLLKGAFLKRRLTPRPEPEQIAERAAKACERDLFVFEGLKDYFTRLTGWEDFLQAELKAIIRPKWIEEVDAAPRFPIAINVRCGDFKEPEKPEDMFTKGGMRTPIPWFVRTLEAVRKAMGFKAKAMLISDGREHELRELLAQESVELVHPSNAICGMLMLSQASVLIGAGGSTFSGWASFLGGMPTVTHPGQHLNWFGLRGRRDQFVGVFDPEQPDPQFLEQVARAGNQWGRQNVA